MPEWEKYLERAGEALSSAKILFENGKYNSAVSESYYSQYYAARALLNIKDLHPKKHKGVAAMLGMEFVNKGYIEGTYVKAFIKDMQMREKADYDVYFKASEEEAEAVIDDAGRFLDRVVKVIDDIREKEKA